MKLNKINDSSKKKSKKKKKKRSKESRIRALFLILEGKHCFFLNTTLAVGFS